MLAVDVQGTSSLSNESWENPREPSHTTYYAVGQKVFDNNRRFLSEAHNVASFDEAYVARFGSSVPEKITSTQAYLVCSSGS